MELKKLKYDGKNIYVEAAYRDSSGNVITRTYVTNTSLSSTLTKYATTSSVSSLSSSLSSLSSSVSTNTSDITQLKTDVAAASKASYEWSEYPEEAERTSEAVYPWSEYPDDADVTEYVSSVSSKKIEFTYSDDTTETYEVYVK